MSLHETAMKQAAGTGSVLASALGFSVMADPARVQQQLQQHPEMLQLLLTNVAAMASQMYYQMGGKTAVQTGSQTSSSSSSSKDSGRKQASSSRQQRKQEFPAMHDHLFAALDCPNAAEVLGMPEVKVDEHLIAEGIVQACSSLCTALQLLGDPEVAADLSSSSSRVRQSVQQEQWRQILTPEVCLGLLDSTTQLLLLQPDLSAADVALAMAHLACSYTCAATEKQPWHQALWTEATAVDSCRKMLTLLVPAVQHSIQAGSKLTEGRRCWAALESASLYGLGRLLTLVAVRADAVPLVPVESADLAGSAAAFEAALRCLSRPRVSELQTFQGSPPELLYTIHRIAATIAATAGCTFHWFQEVKLQETAPAADAAAAAKAREAALAALSATRAMQVRPSPASERAAAAAV